MAQCVSLNLKEIAVPDPNQTPALPRPYHERTGHVLPDDANPLQAQLDALKEYARIHQMKINETKTKVMIFNQATSVDVYTKVKIDQDNIIEVVEQMKLLGIIIRSDMKWCSNTKNMVAKCYKRMWMLRNLKRNGADQVQLLKVYNQQVRSVAEMACPVWNAGITIQEVNAIERIQKTALAIILGGSYSYTEALAILKIDTLESRRTTLCLKFALKAVKNPKFSGWFALNDSEVNTRSVKLPFKKINCRTRRFRKSPIPYLTDLLNTHLPTLKQKSETQIQNILDRLEERSSPLSEVD